MRRLVWVWIAVLGAGLGLGYWLRTGSGSDGAHPQQPAATAKPPPPHAPPQDGRVRVRVDVRRLDGARAAAASVYFAKDPAGGADALHMDWRAERSQGRIPAGFWWIWAAQDDTEILRSAKQRVVLRADRDSAPVILELKRHPGIHGRVVLPEPLQLRGTRIAALRFRGKEAPDTDAVMESDEAVRGSFDAATGRYRVTDLAPGRYAVVFFMGERLVGAKAVVDVVDRAVRKDLEVPSFDRDHFLVVRIQDETGTIVPGPTLHQSYFDEGRTIASSAPMIEREDASLYVPKKMGTAARIAAHMKPSGRYTLSITTPQHGRVERPYTLETREDVIVRLLPPARLRLTITGYAEHKPDVEMVVCPVTDARSGVVALRGRPSAISATGTVVLPIMQPGDVRMALVAQSTTGPVIAALFRLAVPSGRSTHSVEMPTLHELRVVGAGGRMVLTRQSEHDSWLHQRGTPDEGGAILFRHVPAGRYRLEDSEDKGQSVEVVVPRDKVIRLP